VLAGAGATVVSTARSVPASQPAGVHFVESDVSSAAGVSDLAERSLKLLGGVDIVVSNAGGQRFRGAGALALTDEDYWAGTADEFAMLVLFLVSSAGSYLTGSQFTVDGGRCRPCDPRVGPSAWSLRYLDFEDAHGANRAASNDVAGKQPDSP
jgi:NAD(P)-dependent dehydrogenase (short-subunit alcohol dehydrogenase family)